MGGGVGESASSSSSGEEDGDAEWRAAIDSIASAASNGSTKCNFYSTRTEDDDDPNPKSRLKLYQIKAQKLLDDLVEKSIELVRNPMPLPESNPQSDDCGVQLFRKAPRGIILDPIDPYSVPLKRPRIIPGEEIEEKSKKFRRQLRSVAVDGADIIAAARVACQRSLARFEAKDAAAKAKARREEERIAELKKIRGEKWLPSITREMQVNFPRLTLCNMLHFYGAGNDFMTRTHLLQLTKSRVELEQS